MAAAGGHFVHIGLYIFPIYFWYISYQFSISISWVFYENTFSKIPFWGCWRGAQPVPAAARGTPAQQVRTDNWLPSICLENSTNAHAGLPRCHKSKPIYIANISQAAIVFKERHNIVKTYIFIR